MKDTLSSPEDFERALLRSVRADVPPQGGADVLAMKLGLGAAGAAAIAASASAASAGSATKITTVSLASKLFGAVASTGFALGVVTASAGFGVYELHAASVRATAATKSAPATPAVMPPVPTSAADSFATPTPVPPPTVEANDLPSAPSEHASHPVSRAVPTVPPTAPAVRAGSGELGAEVQILSTAKELLESHNTSGAQAAVDRYKRDFPAGAFQAEARALEIDIAAAEGRRADVKQLGARFLAAYPTSPHVARVRAAMESATP